MNFLGAKASRYPVGHGMFLLALLEHEMPAAKITVVLGEQDEADVLSAKLSPDAAVTLLHKPTAEYPLKDGKTTFYVCKGHSCLPPVNDLSELM